jgi:murein DD-endopeptidase MepM/ murein hydrolase activator NlpD
VAGNTGISTGAHLHFGYYPKNENLNNGYGGSADPMPFYDNRFCLDIKTQINIIQKMIEIYQTLIKILGK